MNKKHVINLVVSALLTATIPTFAYEAPLADTTPSIDGIANDSAWQQADWAQIDQIILGEAPSADDFQGRYKVVWTPDKLYLLAEITDDVVIDTHPDPLSFYWDDDTLEVFIDEDKSGGNHLASYNAFAYHIALDNQSVDFNSNGKPRTLNDHVTSSWKRSMQDGNKIIWEAAISIYPDSFTDHDNTAEPVTLTTGKQLGFMLAYCDSDGFKGREHFIGSHDIEPVNGDKNRGYIDASVFGTLTLANPANQK
ncbi:hypothetical protein GCM10008090_22500 [Arenicella chitinivorans]|uniref:Carbohydrate-binding domain-containing protein n=1 Tax=Arenicella chitinivorans TaxID=1329800 RepID=A0A918RTE4_9GAMM|nr:sugar-binding protein [Arenicella chitinivorans]GHA12132.1 hypothetical protein GCM10008090_22500 [Arenicella chitinivorans]